MAQPTTTFFDEFMAAARGCLALLVGDRQASSYFDFSQRGLVGSFIAIVLSFGIQVLAPQLSGGAAPAGVSFGVLVLGSLVVAFQFGIAWLVLRQLGRLDGFVPFLVAQNWASLFQSIIATALSLVVGPPVVIDPGSEMIQLNGGSIPYLMLGIASLVIMVNVGRLIVTLQPLHVAFFVVAQLATALIVQPLLAAML